MKINKIYTHDNGLGQPKGWQLFFDDGTVSSTNENVSGSTRELIDEYIFEGGTFDPIPFANTIDEAKNIMKDIIVAEGENKYFKISKSFNFSSTSTNSFRTAIRNNVRTAITEIDALTTIDDVKNYIMGWPENPNPVL